MKYMSRPKSAAVKNIDIDIDNTDILGQKYRYRINIGKSDIDPPPVYIYIIIIIIINTVPLLQSVAVLTKYNVLQSVRFCARRHAVCRSVLAGRKVIFHSPDPGVSWTSLPASWDACVKVWVSRATCLPLFIVVVYSCWFLISVQINPISQAVSQSVNRFHPY